MIDSIDPLKLTQILNAYRVPYIVANNIKILCKNNFDLNDMAYDVLGLKTLLMERTHEF